jgi:hypothetical protein
MSRRRLRRRADKVRRHTPLPGNPPRDVVRQVEYVERLAYTRAQAAEALGVSRSTFVSRVLPYIDTIEMPWGASLIPVDELERLTSERRRAARRTPKPSPPGRPPVLAQDVVERISADRAAGKSLHRIAADLNADAVPTAHDGARWWPSTVRAVLGRAPAPHDAQRL